MTPTVVGATDASSATDGATVTTPVLTLAVPDSDWPHPDRLRHAARLTGGAVFVVGCLVVLGWTLDPSALDRLIPGDVTTKANSGLALALLGASLWLLAPELRGRRAAIAGMACAVGASAIGLATLSEDVFNIDLGIDELVASDELAEPGDPGRAGPATALGLAALGLSLALRDLRPRASGWLATTLALTAGAVGLEILIGLFTEVPTDQLGPVTEAAPLSAVALIALSAGVMLARPEREPTRLLASDSGGGALARRLLPAVILLPLLLGFLRLAGGHAGLFTSEVGTLMLVSVLIAALVAAVWWMARALDRGDRERRTEAVRRQAILDTARDAIVSADASGRIVAFNHRAEGMFAMTEAEAVGAPVTILMPERFKAAHEAGLARFITTGKPRLLGHTVEFAGHRADGGEFPLELTLLSFVLGEERFFTGTLTDITRRKRDEQQLHNQAEVLRERADELARSNAELEQFAYIASHDLTEPLRTISGFAELLERRHGDKLDGEASEFLTFVVDGTVRMKRLIEDLLTYSRAGRAELLMAPVDCSQVVAEVTQELASTITEAGVELEVGELPTVRGDPMQLARVFRNLIANAAMFRTAEGPRIWISAARAGAGWRFTVADNGIGIEPRHAERVFRMFQRLHGGEQYEGTGIGLAVCRLIVERHGGTIWIESRPQGGTQVEFTIPEPETGDDLAAPQAEQSIEGDRR